MPNRTHSPSSEKRNGSDFSRNSLNRKEIMMPNPAFERSALQRCWSVLSSLSLLGARSIQMLNL